MYKLCRGKKFGFTLIELLVVIAIIGILSTLAMAAFNTTRRNARDAQRMSEVREIQKALEFYYGDVGQYPNGTIGSQEQNGPLGPPDRITLSRGAGFSASPSGDVYMTKVPASSTPPQVASVPDNVYNYAATASNYVLSFYLESSTGALPAGVNCIDKNGMVAATDTPPACPSP